MAARLCSAHFFHSPCTALSRLQTAKIQAASRRHFGEFPNQNTSFRIRRRNSNFGYVHSPTRLVKHSVLITRANESDDRSKSEASPSDKEWTIPPGIYRPFEFPDVQKMVRELGPGKQMACGLAFLAMLAGVAWLRNLGVGGLVDDAESLFVETARQMIVTGDYLTPQFNAVPRLEKPILMYWLMAISVKLFGTEVWAFRLPSLLCGMGLLTGLFLTVRNFGVHLLPGTKNKAENLNRSFGDHFLPAIIAAAAFALNLEVVVSGSVALSEMLFSTNVGLSLFSFFWAYVGQDQNPPKHCWGYSLSAFFVGLACLSSGPVGILFPACVCTCFLLWTEELVKVFTAEFPKWRGLLLVLLINLPWYGLMHLRHGSMFLSTLLGYFSSECFMRGVRGQPWWYGVAVLFFMFFPWCLSLPSTLIEANPWRYKYSWLEYPRCKRLSLFATVWFMAGFGLCSFFPSQPLFLLPVAPAVALLAAAHLSLPSESHGDGLATGLIPALLYQILAGHFLLLPGLLKLSNSAKVVAIGNEMTNGTLHVVAFAVFALAGVLATRTEEYMNAYCPNFWSAIASLKAEPQSSKALLPLWALHTAVMVLIMGAFVTPCFQLVDTVQQLPVRQLAVKAAELQQPGESLIMVGERMTSVVFYSQLPTTFCETTLEAANVLKEYANNLPSALVISNEGWEGSAVLAQEENFCLMRVVVPV